MKGMKRHNNRKWKARVESLAATSLFLVIFTVSGSSSAATRTWDGGGANFNASTAANWVDNIAPAEGDAIVLNTTSHKNMTWDLDIAPASWTQAGYNGTVTVATVYNPAGFTNLKITGNCIISNGVWTHAANSGSEVNRLGATIGGDLVIGPAGAIDVTGRGYGPQQGPGQGRRDSRGGSYGGRGGEFYSQPLDCYGCIVTPTNLGSGAQSAGGGAIQISVGGSLRHEGLIASDGAVSGTSGSGDSVWLTCGSLSGAGIIRALPA